MLFNVEREAGLRQVLRIYGRASVRMDAKAIRAYGLPAVPEIILTPGGIRNELAHLRQFGLRRDYRAQSKL